MFWQADFPLFVNFLQYCMNSVKITCYLSLMNDGEFINYYLSLSYHTFGFIHNFITHLHYPVQNERSLFREFFCFGARNLQNC